jgi:cytochrome P450
LKLSLSYVIGANWSYSHETTSSALTWVLYQLATHQSYQSILRSELQTAFVNSGLNLKDGTSDIGSILDSLPYLNAICAETFRVCPSVPNTLRVAVRDTTLGSTFIPAGTEFIITPWQTNRSRDLWGSRAEEFWPERWIDFSETDQAKKEGRFNNHGGGKSNFAMLTFLHG